MRAEYASLLHPVNLSLDSLGSSSRLHVQAHSHNCRDPQLLVRGTGA
jgi:hypothetical protein